MVKYNVDAITKLLVESYLADLVEHFKYPAEIKNFDYENNLGVCLNNAVWDVHSGMVLKLVEGREISHAILGFESLDREEIVEVFGEPPVYQHLKWP
jgi:hypothetical protein